MSEIHIKMSIKLVLIYVVPLASTCFIVNLGLSLRMGVIKELIQSPLAGFCFNLLLC